MSASLRVVTEDDKIRMNSADHVVDMLIEAQMFEDRAKKLKQQCKLWVDENGDEGIVVNGKRWGGGVTESEAKVSIKLAELIAVLLEIGCSVKHMNAFKAAMKERGFGIMKPVKRWCWRKVAK